VGAAEAQTALDPVSEGADKNGSRKSAKKASGRHRRIMPDRPFWQELPLLVVIALVAAFLLKTFVVQVFFIPSISMENTLVVKDRVLVDKVTYNFRDIRRGEIIVFDANGVLVDTPAASPSEEGNVISRSLGSFAGALGLAQSNDTDYIKRVIGLPGDRVACCDANGRMTVNGIPLDETSYLYPGDRPSTSTFDVVVPADKLWVMGDHRSQSADSRSRIGSPGGGFVPIDRVVGKAVVRSWPLSRIGTLPVPDTFEQPAIEQNRGTAQ
jgi:signal peptidase I